MRVLVVIIALTAAGWAVAAPTSTDMQVSQCYNCHAPGLWEPPMQEPKITEYRFRQAEDGWWFEADVQNTWGHDMLQVSGSIDLSMHAGMSLRAMHNGTVETHAGSFDVNVLPTERFAVIEAEVGPQAQALAFRLETDTMLPHELEMQVESPCIMGPCIVTKTHRGGMTEIAFTAEDLAAHGAGQWWARIHADSMSGRVDYRLIVEQAGGPAHLAWASGAEAEALPSETVTLRWPVAFGDDARGPAQVTLQYVSSFDHSGTEPDAEFLRMMSSVEVTTRDGTPSFLQLPQEEPEDNSIPVPAVLAIVGLALVAWRRR